MDWRSVLCEARCYDVLLPRATQAANEVLSRCPAAEVLLDAGARDDIADLCLGRLRTLYEHLMLRAVLKRMEQDGALPASAGDLDPAVVRTTADALREDLLDDGGARLWARAPLAKEYEGAIVCNFVSAFLEMLERLNQKRANISSQLLGGKPLRRIRALSDTGGDVHRHGRAVLRVATNAGTFYYKPRPWGIDALLGDLVDCWFPGCAVVPRFVAGDGYSFAEQVVPPASLSESDVVAYWRNLGALTALFHGVGSRDMTRDNIVCAGVRPAVVDAETLLTGGLVQRAGGGSASRPSVLNSSILPWPGDIGNDSPLTSNNAASRCLPCVEGTARTVAGFEQDFMDGFVDGYQRLVGERSAVTELLERARGVACRKVLLNTDAYMRARASLFSAKGLADVSQQQRVLRWLWDRYDGPTAGQRLALAKADVAVLAEGDIPYYSSTAEGLTLYGADCHSTFDGVLERSALELARDRMALLGEDDLGYELDVIRQTLAL